MVLFSPSAKVGENAQLSNEIDEFVVTVTKDLQDYAKSGKLVKTAQLFTFLKEYERICKPSGSSLILTPPVVTIQDLEDFRQKTECVPNDARIIIEISDAFKGQIKHLETSCAESETEKGKAQLQKFKRHLSAQFLLFHAMRGSFKTISEPPTVDKGSFAWVCE